MKSLTLSLIILSAFIVRRHDIPDDKYLAYGKDPAFQSLAIFTDGCGTLVSERWVLTARHVASDQALGDPVIISGKKYEIDKISLYPIKQVLTADLALVRLTSAVDGVKPAQIPRKAPKEGVTIHLAGNGDTGTGQTGPESMDKKLRAATNRIDRVTDMHIEFLFDRPGSETITPLEGISGPGDSGGPAYILEEGHVTLAGVSSAQELQGQSMEGLYGVKELYVNVSNFVNWIDDVLEGKEYFSTSLDGQEALAIFHNDQLISLELDQKPVPSQSLNSYQEQLWSLFKESKEKASKPAYAPAERIPAFINYMKKLAVDLKLVPSLQNVSFSIDKESLSINGKQLSAMQHEAALDKYKEIFGKPLTEGINFSAN